jgi:hypothetical protein
MTEKWKWPDYKDAGPEVRIAYGAIPSNYLGMIQAAINEILEADRAQRGDSRLAELQQLAREKQAIRALDTASGHSDENDDRYVANEVNIRTALDRLAASPIIKPDNSGIDDGPYLPGQSPRKRAAPKTQEESALIRITAWETRRRKYGERGHR